MRIEEGDDYTDIKTEQGVTIEVIHNKGDGVELVVYYDIDGASAHLTNREVDALCSALQRAKTEL